MTHIDLGIDEASFAASLRVIGHPWRAGRRCQTGRACSRHRYEDDAKEHNIPIPAVTAALLMRMVREGVKRDADFLNKAEKMSCGGKHWCAGSLSAADRPSSCGLDKNHSDHYFNYQEPIPVEAAIIHATAALDKEC